MHDQRLLQAAPAVEEQLQLWPCGVSPLSPAVVHELDMLDMHHTADDLSSSLSDWMAGLSPRLHQGAAAAAPGAGMPAAAAFKQAGVVGTSGAGPLLTDLTFEMAIESPLNSCSGSHSGSCSTHGPACQLSPGVQQQLQQQVLRPGAFPQQQQQQQQLQASAGFHCADYPGSVSYAPGSNMSSSGNPGYMYPPAVVADPPGCWPGSSGFSTGGMVGGLAPAAVLPQGQGPAAGGYFAAAPAGYHPGHPHPAAAAAPAPGAFQQGPPTPAFAAGMLPGAAAAAAAAAPYPGFMPAAGSSYGPVSCPPAGPFFGPTGYPALPQAPPMYGVMGPGMCADPGYAYPPAAGPCMEPCCYVPAPMPAHIGFEASLAGQHSSSSGPAGLAGYGSSSFSSMQDLSAAAGAASGSATAAAAQPRGGVTPADASSNAPRSAAGTAAAPQQRARSPGAPAKQQMPLSTSAAHAAAKAKGKAGAAAAPAATKPAAAAQAGKAGPAAAAGAAAAKSSAAAAKSSAAAAAPKVQSGGVSKPPKAGAGKPLLSKAVKRRIREEQEQCVMQASGEKIKELADKKERLTSMLQQLQESRDRAAAALAKLRGTYDTVTAQNKQLQADNAELRALIDGLKAQVDLSG